MADFNEIQIDMAPAMDLFAGIELAAGDPRPLMGEIAEIMSDAVQENFAKEGRSAPWAPLAQATLDERAKGGYTGKILQRTGQFITSFLPFHDENEAGVGSAHPASAIHHFGGQAGPGRQVTIPGRPYLELHDDDLADIDDAIQNFLSPED